jgi:hypothetical protein
MDDVDDILNRIEVLIAEYKDLKEAAEHFLNAWYSDERDDSQLVALRRLERQLPDYRRPKDSWST